MKKEYRSPEAEKLALEDGDLERVSGGTEEEDYGGAGNWDAGTGRGRGGGCEGIHYHQNARTFSTGRDVSC